MKSRGTRGSEEERWEEGGNGRICLEEIVRGIKREEETVEKKVRK